MGAGEKGGTFRQKARYISIALQDALDGVNSLLRLKWGRPDKQLVRHDTQAPHIHLRAKGRSLQPLIRLPSKTTEHS